jgi:hypothetical protein
VSDKERKTREEEIADTLWKISFMLTYGRYMTGLVVSRDDHGAVSSVIDGGYKVEDISERPISKLLAALLMIDDTKWDLLSPKDMTMKEMHAGRVDTSTG